MSILENAKGIAEAVHHLQNLELYQRVLALHSDIVGLVEQNIGLREEITELRKQASLKEKMRFTAPFYYQEGDKTPFCAVCFEKKPPLAIHVVFGHDTDWETRWDCPACKQMYVIRKGDPGPTTTDDLGSLGDQGWMR